MNDILTSLIDYENGEMETNQEVVDLFQRLVDSGLAWTLQGHYGRTAAYLLDAGVITLPADA